MHFFKDDNPEEKYTAMITQPVSRLIPSLAIPTVTSMLVSSIYNMADTYFVSQLGTSASAAVGIVFSLMSIIQAIGFMLGMGAGSLISRKLGEKDAAAANKYASSAFAAAFVLGTLLTIFGLLFIDNLMEKLGSSPSILPYARDYARYILIGAPIMACAFVMNNVLRAEGHAQFSMIALTSGGIINMFLDPIFIFAFKLGTAGAAIATLISQCISFAIFMQFFMRRKGIVNLHISYVSRTARDYFNIITTGLPSFSRQGLASVSTVILNKQAILYGDAAVAGISIARRIILLLASVMIGIGQGFTPVAGYNYGAKKYGRVKQAYWFTVKCGAAILFIAAVILFVCATHIIAAFRDDIDVIKIGVATLRFEALSLPLHGIITGTNMLMQATGKKIQATFLSCNRQGIYFIPLIMLLPIFFGLTGIESAQAGADVLSALTTIPYVAHFMKELSQRKNAETSSQQVTSS
ncbi:MAG: MATE family efflux transporter [Treponema sp.]|nr:MATE family efflux transporter [Treponema sp.]